MKPSQRKHEKKLDLTNNQGHTNKNSRIPLSPLRLAKLVLERIWKMGRSMPATLDSNSAVSRKTENAHTLSGSSSVPVSDLEKPGVHTDVIQMFIHSMTVTMHLLCVLHTRDRTVNEMQVAPSFIQLTFYLRRDRQ